MLLKWIGGKHQLAPFIISKMPHHTRYCECFFGAGHVFWQKNLADANIVNDLNGKLVNLYKAIQNEKEKEELIKLVDNTIYSRELFESYRTIYDSKSKWLDVKNHEARAFIFLYLNKVSFNGQMLTFAKRDDASPIMGLDRIIEKMFSKLKIGKVVIENQHFHDFLDLKWIDKPGTLIYLDPPYIITTETQGQDYYEKVMSVEEHTELRNILYKMKDAKWLLSYDDHPKVLELYQSTTTKPIYITKTPQTNQSAANYSASVTDTEAVYKQELLIANYDLEKVGTFFGTSL